MGAPCSTVCVYQSLHLWYMYLCLLNSPCLLHHFSILRWKHGFFCAVLWVCWSHPIPWLECVHASVQDLCQPDLPCLLHPLCTVPWKHGFLCVALCVYCSHPTSAPTPWLQCVYKYIHVFMLKWIPMSPLIPMHSLMETWVPCMAQCMFPSNLISVPTPCLECVHASVHIFMSTQLPMLVQPPMHCYMETWIPLCGSVCVSQSPYHWSHTLIKMYTCISTCTTCQPDLPCLLHFFE